jgi:hypothetical protein
VITHTVLFRPRPDLTADQRRAVASALTAALRDIPSIRGAQVGRRVLVGRPYEQLMRIDYTYAAVLQFDDLAGLRAYLDHPAHVELATRFFEIFEEALMYDFELLDGENGVAGLMAG